VKSFLAVVDAGSLEKAAEHLNVSNTTVFRHIHALEKETGTRLFERIKGRYSLTDAGEEMLAPARQILNNFEAINLSVSGRDIAAAGTVRITAPTSFAYFILPDYFARLQTAYPDISLELLASNQEFNMAERHADIAIRVAELPPEYLVGREIRKIDWGLYANHDMAKKTEQNFNALKFPDRLPGGFIGASGALRNHPVFKWLDENHADRIIHRSDDFVAMAGLARAGIGYACLPADLAIPDLERVTSLHQFASNRLWVLTHPELKRIERIKLVLQWLGNALKNEPRLISPARQPSLGQ